MKPRRSFIAVLPLLVMAGCDLFTNFFNPTPPNPIKPNTDHPPILSEMLADSSSEDAPWIRNLSFKVEDPDGDVITKYGFELDFGGEGAIDKIISQSMSAKEILFPIGRSLVYYYAEAGKVKVKRNLEVIVVKPIPGNLLPTGGKLLISPAFGQYPSIVSISTPDWTDPDGTITGYKLDLIFKTEYDETSETATSSTPFENFTKTLYDVGNLTAYLTVTDDKGDETRTSGNSDSTERDDLVGRIVFEGNYFKGGSFLFSGTIQNATNNDLIANNSNGGGLEYRLIKEDGTLILSKKFEEDAQIKLLSPNGYITLDYKNNQLKIGNGDITKSSLGIYLWETMCGLGLVGTDGEYSIPIPPLDYTFTEPGANFVQILVNYSMNGKEYHKKFTSPLFPVNE